MSKTQKYSFNWWIDYIAIVAIVLVSIGYVLFGASFAQIRIEPHFLNFPIFIGEILLFLCILLFIVKIKIDGWPLERWGWGLGIYLVFVLFKAFTGYGQWGPFAFRDAALFYYPLFVVLGYSFWSNNLFEKRTRYLSLAFLILVFVLHQFISFWIGTLLVLAGFMVLKAKGLFEKLITGFLVFVFFPFDMLFNLMYRTVWLSSMIMLLFLGIITFLWFIKDRRLRILGGVLGLFFLAIFSLKFYHTEIGKTFMIKGINPIVISNDQEIHQAKILFHPVDVTANKSDSIKDFFQKLKISPTSQQPNQELHQIQGVSSNKNQCLTKTQSILGIKQGDTAFRYYIWRDMIHEFLRHKPLFGFDFGRPMRSITMDRYVYDNPGYIDGWIGAHNSFLNIIYRAGIVGVFMIGLLFSTWYQLLRNFYVLKDPIGLGLCAILLNWFVAANFFMIFELPYTAIPIWMILGVALKHRELLKVKGHE